MAIAVLYPRREFATAAEQIASWQTRSRLRRAPDVTDVVDYAPDEPARRVIAEVEETVVLVVLDPLFRFESDLATRLRAGVEQHSRSVVIVSTDSRQDPLLYACAAESLRNEKRTLRQAIEGREVIALESIAVRRWSRDVRVDLLPFIPTVSRALLHVGCEDGTLGQRIKERQRCRVVGIESNREQASIAKRRLDDLYIGDPPHLVSLLEEKFDCVAVTGILEHVEDPWTLLASLREATTPGGLLVTHLPNVAHVRMIADLLDGRFDTERQLRFFARESIEELMAVTGWTIDQIQALTSAESTDEVMISKLRGAGERAGRDLDAPQFVVVARNR